jgi:Possible lysine decarboxylase
MGADGEVIGVIPRSLVEREVEHGGLTDLRIVDSMHQRKALMAVSDGFIAMPGGLHKAAEAGIPVIRAEDTQRRRLIGEAEGIRTIGATGNLLPRKEPRIGELFGAIILNTFPESVCTISSAAAPGSPSVRMARRRRRKQGASGAFRSGSCRTEILCDWQCGSEAKLAA